MVYLPASRLLGPGPRRKCLSGSGGEEGGRTSEESGSEAAARNPGGSQRAPRLDDAAQGNKFDFIMLVQGLQGPVADVNIDLGSF